MQRGAVVPTEDNLKEQVTERTLNKIKERESKR